MIELPTIRLKTRTITFDDRLQQVRIMYGHRMPPTGGIRMLNYKDDAGFRYLKKYRKNWQQIIRL